MNTQKCHDIRNFKTLEEMLLQDSSFYAWMDNDEAEKFILKLRWFNETEEDLEWTVEYLRENLEEKEDEIDDLERDIVRLKDKIDERDEKIEELKESIKELEALNQ